jgi:23S rRNA (cytidine1920-2'-O)/16S rRNA (cytidine1409-2'-O)-methyltransferase
MRGVAQPPAKLIDRVRRDFPELGDAEAVIRAGKVTVDRVIRLNPAFRVRAGAHVAVADEQALRGEAKLRPALERFGVSVEGRVALDVGASAGGFTKVLLERGAARVYAVDAGHGQLLGSLRSDQRVVNLEATNVGVLSTELVPDPIDVVTVDVSYLSLSAAVEQVNRIRLAPDADVIGLVKPMFELRLATAPDDDARLEQARARAVEGIESAGWTVRDWMHSPVRGAHGARELLVHATRRGATEV